VDINNVNHVGMAVRDLKATAARYEAMGFQLTPYSPHSGAFKPGEPVKPLGSGNRCVMFENTYLEILANEDNSKPAERMIKWLSHHQGGHIICFDSGDCTHVDKRVRGLGIETSGVIPLQREIDTPEGMRTAKFERCQLAANNSPEGYIQFTRHLTPQYIYQPRYIRHPNGAVQLAETILVADDLAGFVKKYSDYLPVAPVRYGNGAQFKLPLGTTLTILGVSDARALLPGTLMPPIPGIAAVAFRMPKLAETRQRLAGNGFTVIDLGERFMVPAEEASGLAVIFGS
jgi:catechol 2,3-dioxygenase-like lactoylglutathione lyase family enzyme